MTGIEPAEEGAPVGPSPEEEAALLSTEDDSEALLGKSASAGDMNAEDESAPLPPMEDLVNRIPASARELIEELFRARFVTVKRLPKTALKGK